MLKVKNLHASVDGKEILRGIDLEVRAGEVHAIMGPNGSGKATLASVLAGNEKFTGILTMFSNPILGMLAGLVLTAVIQSSSASIGILQALSMS